MIIPHNLNLDALLREQKLADKINFKRNLDRAYFIVHTIITLQQKAGMEKDEFVPIRRGYLLRDIPALELDICLDGLERLGVIEVSPMEALNVPLNSYRLSEKYRIKEVREITSTRANLN
jgi:hypothetical protein